jgi:Mor family transcriptional regulator
MGFKKSEKILPDELIQQIQQYVDGQTVYIPRKSEKRKRWGERTGSDRSLDERNAEIFAKYIKGVSVRELSEKYYISKQGIYKILKKFK